MLTMLMICLRLSQRFEVKLGRVNADVCSGGSTSCRVRRPETRLRAIEAFERATRKHRSSTSPSTSRLERTRTMAAGLHICGLVAGVLSWCLQSSCTSSQLWKVRSQAESLSSSHWQFEGLWMSCAATSLGTLQCNKFKTLIGLPGSSWARDFIWAGQLPVWRCWVAQCSVAPTGGALPPPPLLPHDIFRPRRAVKVTARTSTERHTPPPATTAPTLTCERAVPERTVAAPPGFVKVSIFVCFCNRFAL
ncbi:uncharacterized protein LOC133482477 isoform X2 [Phyllopteryx taeniolatus]|uniref:uncharacterized protein LOC133482477 isoform X2 n=1 Tax=Phyllopteryx taeniolatus TaxID=161469 RepID=UPI002AD44108|nr:uncharacterized protein LOC133482477 isoform X2 [Phyllopteryx taeniolatus]